ncbi:MAG: hypothetical protein ACE5K0_05295 [Candidatus Methanofastidiosia archaeon]
MANLIAIKLVAMVVGAVIKFMVAAAILYVAVKFGKFLEKLPDVLEKRKA